VIERLALSPYADRPARTLSLGNAQRLGLAKALIHHPELVILDEPANGLDPAGVVEVRNLLRTLAFERGTTVFMSSHILGEVARLATRVGIIHEGRLVQELDAEEVSARERRRLVVATRDLAAARAALRGYRVELDGSALLLTDERAIARPDDIATLLVHAGCPPTRLAVEHEDLEAYFLRLVGADHA
jgi:ABC-2 type transport system ATP-binding protein